MPLPARPKLVQMHQGSRITTADSGIYMYVQEIQLFLMSIKSNCSVSRWRPQKVDKRMVLEHTHGLFIT